MKIAFIPTIPVAENPHKFHRDQFIFNALKKYGHELIAIQPQSDHSRSLSQKTYGKLVRYIGWNYRHERSPKLLKAFANNIMLDLQRYKVDLVFSLSTLFTAYLETQLPTVSWADAVFKCIEGYYESHKNMDPLSIWQGHHAEERSLQRCDISILSSNWAANIAARHYSFPLERLRVVAFGPNLHEYPDMQDILTINKRTKGKLTCLVVGVDWLRKGADTAWRAVSLLRGKDMNINMTTIGMEPPEDLMNVPGLTILPRLRKHVPSEWNLFKQALMDADVLLLASSADFTPHVINEAYAFGLPVLASGTGAIPEMVDQGITGYIVNNQQSSREFAIYIEKLATNSELLLKMKIAAKAKFENEMSLDVMANKLTAIFNYAVASKSYSGIDV